MRAEQGLLCIFKGLVPDQWPAKTAFLWNSLLASITEERAIAWCHVTPSDDEQSNMWLPAAGGQGLKMCLCALTLPRAVSYIVSLPFFPINDHWFSSFNLFGIIVSLNYRLLI